MPRITKIKAYNPNLTVEENAKKNGVEVSTMRHFIQVNGIDRKRDRRLSKIKLCKKYLKEHPDTTREKMHQETGVSITFIRRNWEYISTKATPTDFNQNKIDKINQKYSDILDGIPIEQVNRYLNEHSTKEQKELHAKKDEELWNDALKDIPTVLEKADSIDVSELREFFMEKPEMPMLFIGSGGANGSFPALLYSMNKGIGVDMTPLQFASLSDDAVRSCRIMLLSKGGGNDDINYASKRAAELNPENTACITSYDSPKNCLLKNLGGTSAKIFIFKGAGKSGFVSVRGKFQKYILYLKAFTGKDNISSLINVDLNPERCFKYELNRDGAEPINLGKIEHFCILYGGYGKPVASDFESVFAESGMGSVQVCDYRNYCHGRFIFPTNFTENDKEPRFSSNVAMVLLITPRERKLAKQIREVAIPNKTPVITVETDFDNALASLDLLIKSNVLIGYIGENCKKINPLSPPNYNAQDIDKRKPINTVKFIKDLKDNGELNYIDEGTEPVSQKHTSKKSVNVAELKALIDELKEVEKKNSESLQVLPPPTIETLTRWEEYDASEYLCYAFRKKGDLRKGKVLLDLGNMCGGYGYDMHGVHFKNSEAAYICGMFSDDSPEHVEIQQALIKEGSGFDAKKFIRMPNEGIARKDWHEFNQQWMLYVVWQKIQGNEDFRNLLMVVPEGATIIEDSSFQKGATSAFWGTINNERKDFGTVLKKYLDATLCDDAKGKRKQAWLSEFNNFTDYGTYRGSNVMGKILTICRRCLTDGTEPAINYELLKSKHIHLLGKELTF